MQSRRTPRSSRVIGTRRFTVATHPTTVRKTTADCHFVPAGPEFDATEPLLKEDVPGGRGETAYSVAVQGGMDPHLARRLGRT
jgi:hypothetical protein